MSRASKQTFLQRRHTYVQQAHEKMPPPLLSRFSCVRLCATSQTAAHQAPPPLGFSRQEPWSGLPSARAGLQNSCPFPVNWSSQTSEQRPLLCPPGSTLLAGTWSFSPDGEMLPAVRTRSGQ